MEEKKRWSPLVCSIGLTESMSSNEPGKRSGQVKRCQRSRPTRGGTVRQQTRPANRDHLYPDSLLFGFSASGQFTVAQLILNSWGEVITSSDLTHSSHKAWKTNKNLPMTTLLQNLHVWSTPTKLHTNYSSMAEALVKHT